MLASLLKKIRTGEPLHHAYLIISPEVKTTAGAISRLLGQDTLTEYHKNFLIEHSRSLKERQNLKFAGQKQCFVVAVENITYEAQQALLKTLEEPNPGNHFFLIVPKIDTIYGVLRSRFEIIVAKTTPAPTAASDFLRMAPGERLQLIEGLSGDKKAVSALLNSLEAVLAVPEQNFALTELKKTRGYLERNIGGGRLALDHLALIIQSTK